MRDGGGGVAGEGADAAGDVEMLVEEIQAGGVFKGAVAAGESDAG